jgi:hypothetical protein
MLEKGSRPSLVRLLHGTLKALCNKNNGYSVLDKHGCTFRYLSSLLSGSHNKYNA